jgi:hypothetical protein
MKISIFGLKIDDSNKEDFYIEIKRCSEDKLIDYVDNIKSE